VLGQLEVVLIAPAWLPPMEQWYSGLLPYPLLLPAQILILMLMTGLVVRWQLLHALPAFPPSLAVSEMRRPPSSARVGLRIVALIYFAAMLLRLIVQYFRGADDLIAAGGIPVAFHWVLALFLLVLSTSTREREP
jgi:hypothetical protein